MRSNVKAHMPLQYTDRGASDIPVATGLPSNLMEALRSRAERLHHFTGGQFEPSPPPVLLDKLTDQLLVVASDAVTAVAAATLPALSGKATLRLLAWVVADARGATTPLEKALAETVGKRLEKQAQKVRETLAAATADAAEARESARAAAAQDANLAAALAAELAAIDALEQGAYDRARDEVYIGFHELGSGSTAASGPLSVSVEQPQSLPAWVREEPEEGPVRDGLLQRALERILTQQSTIDQLRDQAEWQERCVRRERVSAYEQRREDERCQLILRRELWDTEWALRDAREELEEMRQEIEARVQDRTADLEYELERARARGRLATGNDVLRRRVWELEAEVTRLTQG